MLECRALIITRPKLSFASRDGQKPSLALSSCFDPPRLVSLRRPILYTSRGCSQAPSEASNSLVLGPRHSMWVGGCIPSATHCLDIYVALYFARFHASDCRNLFSSLVTVLARTGSPAVVTLCGQVTAESSKTRCCRFWRRSLLPSFKLSSQFILPPPAEAIDSYMLEWIC